MSNHYTNARHGGYEAEGNKTSESLSFLLKVMQKELRVWLRNEFRLPEL